MVKGLSKKVIIVKSPDPKIFEQAIFIVRDDYLSSQGITQKELLKQARRAANGYVSHVDGPHKIQLLLSAIIGGVFVSVIWIAIKLLS